jgi:hypothetical protein
MTNRYESRPEKASRWVVGWAHRADEATLLALFARAFGHEMPAAQWRWKYAGLDPIGSMVRRDGIPVAFYGGMAREILWFGTPMTAVQIGDVMVDPAERGVMTRHGPFFLATTAYAERFVGPGRAYALAFGFPSERHTRLGEHLGVYSRVDEVLEATWTPLPRRFDLLHRARPLTLDQLDTVDTLWHKMADQLAAVAIAVRSGLHVRHRFLEHPAANYLCLLVRRRFTGTVTGLVIVRDHGEPGLELIDVVAPPESFSTLVAIARRVADRLRRNRVFAWMTPRAAESFSESAPALAPAGIPIPTIVWRASPDIGKLRGNWWLMGGDADSR